MRYIKFSASVILFFLSAYCCRAQKDTLFVWNKWCERKDTLVLFTSAYNVIEVYCPTLKPDDLSFKCLDKTIKISSPEITGDTVAMPAMPYTTDKPMRVGVFNKRTNKLIKTLFFYGANVPNPKARLGNIKESEANADVILAQAGLKVFFPGSLYSYPYHVKEYTFKTVCDKKDVKVAVKGRLINREVELAMRCQKQGSVITFTDIKVTCPECITKSIDDLIIKFK